MKKFKLLRWDSNAKCWNDCLGGSIGYSHLCTYTMTMNNPDFSNLSLDEGVMWREKTREFKEPQRYKILRTQ